MSFPLHDFDEIKSRYSIAEVASRLGLETRRESGTVFKARCPFHDDSSPSLYLYDSGANAHGYKCYVCGSAGDTLSLVQNLLGLKNAAQASDWLEGRSREQFIPPPRVVLERSDVPVLNTDLTAFAQEAYQKRTYAAAQYLMWRGLASVMDDYRLGSTDAPDFDHALLPDIFYADSMKTVKHKNFLGRIVIPYFDAQGRVPYVNARAMDDRKPKYLKAQTPHQKYQQQPYLLGEALSGPSSDVLIVEGELDLLSVKAADRRIQVAALPGVDCLPDDALPRFDGKTVWLILDNDDAGRAAREKLETRLMDYAREVVQVVIPGDYGDLNSFLMAQGRRFVAGYLESAFERAVRRVRRRTF